MCGVTRIAIIYHCLKGFMNLALAEKKGMLVKWFPVHFPQRIAQIPENLGRIDVLEKMLFFIVWWGSKHTHRFTDDLILLRIGTSAIHHARNGV